MPEAADIIGKLIARDADARPSAAEVLSHPFWWSDAKKLAFLVDVSDRVEMEDREVGGRRLLSLLERDAMKNALGGGEWVPKLDPSLLENLGRYRKYNAAAVRDFLRVIRNKMSHFRELPAKVQATVGSPPDAFYQYFASRFPGLLLHAYVFRRARMRARVHVPAVLLPARGGHEVFRGGAGEFGARERGGGGQSGGEGGAARRDKRSDERRVPGEAGRAGLRVLDQDRAVQVRRGVQFNHPERIARVMDRRLRLNAHQRRRIGWL